MPVSRMLGKNEVFQAWTTSPYTKSFRHLLPYNRHWERRMTFRDPIIKSAKPKDRIKYWNLVPGDQVRIRGEESKTIYEVLSINKLSNQIRLKVPSSVSILHHACIFMLLILKQILYQRVKKQLPRRCSTPTYNCSLDTTLSHQKKGHLSLLLPRTRLSFFFFNFKTFTFLS